VPSRICWRSLAVVHLWRSAETTSPYLTLFECLVSCSLQTCHSTTTLLRSALSASSSWDNYAASDVRSTTTPSSHWCTRLSPATSTTVSVYWLVHRRRQQTSCNAPSTQLHESYRTVASTTEVWLSSSARLYTGSEFGSGNASKCTSVSTAWLPDIWPVTNVDGHRHLWFAGRSQLDVPPVRLST